VNGYVRRTQEKKSAIIKAARELFFKRGITDVSVSEIAAQAGVAPMSLYNYFGDKQSLVREVLTESIDEILARFGEIIERDIPFTDKLRLLSEQKAFFRSGLSPAFMDTLAWDDKHLRELYEEISAKRSAPFHEKLIAEGKAAGVIDPSIPNEAILDYIQALEPILSWRHLSRASDTYRAGISKLFRYGVFGKEDQPR